MADELIGTTNDKEIAKFREKFRHEKIHELTKNDFEDFLKACPKLFATRSGSSRHEDMHGGLVLATFPETKKALEILVDETSRSLHERLEEINSDAVKFKRKKHFKSAIFSPILWLINPEEYAIFDRTVEIMLKEKYHEEFDSNEWQTYEKANKRLKEIAKEKGCSLYELDQKTENEFGTKPTKKRSSVFQKLKDRIQAIPEQANYQYVMIRFLLGKKSATRDKIAEELKRWNEDKPDNHDFNHAPVFDTNIVKDFTEKVDDTFTLLDHETLNFFEKHQLISLCEEKIRGRIDTYNEGTIPYSDLVFSPLTNKQEIKKAHDDVIAKLKGASSRNQKFKIMGVQNEVYWLDKHSIFFQTNTPTTPSWASAGKCFWDVFGTEEPQWSKTSISRTVLEINPPLPETGEYWGTGGQFLKDNHGRIYYTHNGSVKVNKSKNNFRFNDIYAGLALKTSNYSDGESHSSQFIISDVANSGLVDDVADFVKEVQDFRNFAETPEYQALVEEEPTEYWMIRSGDKGKNWQEQMDDEIIGIHYQNLDLSKCTEKDNSEKLSKEKTRIKADKLRVKKGEKKYSDDEWSSDFGQFEKIFSVNRKKGKCRIVAIGDNTELLGLGDALGQYEYHDELDHPHTIAVKWFDTQKREIPKSWKGHYTFMSRTIKPLRKEEYDLLMSKIQKEGKYVRLTKFLRDSKKDEVSLTFNEIEQIINSKLPQSAHDLRPWWANTQTHSQGGTWLDAGYKVKNGSVSDPPGKTSKVTFVKDDTLQVDSVGVSLQEEDDDHCEEWKDKGYFELLEKKSQMIFYGPPGTGKTWTAKKVAECFTRTKIDGSPPDKFIDRIIDELRERAEDSGYTFEKAGNKTNQNLYVLKKDLANFYDEIRVDFHEANTDYFQVNTGTTFLTENQKAKNYLILTKEEVESFVCLPYEIEQKYSKFVSEGDGTGGWDSSGKGKHSVHNLKINETEAHFEPKDEKSDRKYVSEYLNTWNNLNHNFAASNRGRDIYNVTFHPSYSYEDFVEGFRPNEKENSSSQYVLDDGIFERAAKHAKRHDNRRIVLIIDEINRGNIPKIFGELISIVEHDKRGPKNTLKLAYSKEDFFVPENLYIIGTMNTADKSLVQMDEALRRRFGFEELMPNADLLDKRPASKYKEILVKLNNKIVGTPERMKQYRDKQIGHSYFWDIEDDHDLRFVIKYQIIPLLQDYFYDDYEQIKIILGKKIIGKDNRPTELLAKGRESDLKDALLNFLNNKEQPEPEEEQEEPEPEEEQEENEE